MSHKNTPSNPYPISTLIIALGFAVIMGWLLQACVQTKPAKQNQASRSTIPAPTTKAPKTPSQIRSHSQAKSQKPILPTAKPKVKSQPIHTTQASQHTQSTTTTQKPSTPNPRAPQSTQSTQSTQALESTSTDFSQPIADQADLTEVDSTPLPLNIKAKDILNTPTIKDSHQNITAKKSLDSGFTFVELYGPTGDLRARLSFKGEVLDGISTAYQNGQVAREIPYKDGQIDGIVITHIPPDKRLESSYKNGKKHGKTILYYQDTPISSKTYYNGILHGTLETALDLTDSATYKNTNSLTHYHYGKKQGESIGYANGNIVFKQYYRNDVLQGQTQTYGENAIIKISRHYHNGLLHGEEIVYNYPEETPMYKSHYEFGVLISPYENYEANGAIYYSIAPKDKSSTITQSQHTDTQELWHYANSQQVALQITKDPHQKRVQIFYKNGVLASDSIITATQASISYYTQDALLESKVLYNASSPVKTTWHYTPQGQLLTKSQESPAKTITQSYRDGALESEVVVLESEERTIQKGFFPDGSLQFEHHYIEDTMIQGTLYDKNGRVIYSFPHTNQDMIFDEAFPNTAAKRRQKVLPNY